MNHHSSFLCPSLPPRQEKCIFCEIVQNPTENARVVYQDSDFILFKDINPSALHHYLIIPKIHIPTVKDLNSSHVPMILSMKKIATELLYNNLSIPMEHHVLGFHVPPFTSVDHLHLHVIAKPFKNYFRSWKYPSKDTLWWMNVNSWLKKWQEKVVE